MDHQQETRAVSRRTLVAAAVAGAGAIALAPREALAQSGPVAPPSTVTTPPRDFSRRGAPTTYFTDPDVLTVDLGLVDDLRLHDRLLGQPCEQRSRG